MSIFYNSSLGDLFYNAPLNIWRLTHCPLEDVALILCV